VPKSLSNLSGKFSQYCFKACKVQDRRMQIGIQN